MTSERFREWGTAAVSAVACMLQAVMAAAVAAPLTVEDWRSDIEFARVEMPKRHANLFHAVSQSEYDAALDRLVADLGNLDEHRIVVRLAEIVATVGDGHTRLTLPLDAQAGFFTGHTGTAAPLIEPFHHLPLRLAPADGGYVVTAAGDSLSGLLGARLRAIDGVEVSAVETALAPVVHRDNEHQLRNLTPWFMVVPEVLHARGVSRSPAESTWRFEDVSGRTFEATLTPVPLGAETTWSELPATEWPLRRGPVPRSGLWFADIDRPDAVYARVAEIAD